MKRLKSISIKTRIRNLILSTIFFLILFGCTLAIIIFSYVLKMDIDQDQGMMFVGDALYRYNVPYSMFIIAIVLLGIFLFLLTTHVTNRWLERNIVQPMLETTELMTSIAEGNVDLSKPLSKNAHYFEFSSLLSSIFKMLMNLESSQKSVERIAYYDNLTGLPNRFNLFRKDSSADAAPHKPRCLILMDLDDLNTVNDLYGRAVGDALITKIGHFLPSNLDKNDGFTAYRLGGGSYALLTGNSMDEASLIKIVETIMHRFTRPFSCDSVTLEATMSIGIALRNNSDETVEDLLHHAELAMYEVKRTTKNNYLVYKPEMSDRIREQKEMEEDLKLALELGEFSLVFQPKNNIKSNCCDSFETLIRWNSPKRGFVPPIDFIDLAESSGLIVPIGKWVLSESCRTVKALSLAHGFPYRIAVNISPVQINREDFFRTVFEMLMAYDLEPSQLELEITENLLMTSFSSAVEKLRQLYVLGVSISVDDFGKGYSSLAYLQELPIHTLKIDKLFIDAIETSDENMVTDIIRLGHHMKLKIVAEGVETALQSDYLINAGCDSIQGYHYSRPLSLDQLEVFLTKKQY